MTDRQRHSIRRVIRFRNILQTAEPLNHIHDLVLFRFPVAGYRLLYLHRRILIDRNAGALAGQQNSPPPVSNRDAGRDIPVKKKLFHRNGIRRKKPNQFSGVFINPVQPRRQPGMRRCRNHATAFKKKAVVLIIQNAEADRCDTGVDSQNAHAITSLPNFSIFPGRAQGKGKTGPKAGFYAPGCACR